MNDSIIRRIVQVGIVTAVNGTKVRVLFRESGMTSGWLSVLQHDTAGVTVKEAAGPDLHTHQASVGTWVPKINDVVLCLYIPVANSDGYVIGRCP